MRSTLTILPSALNDVLAVLTLAGVQIVENVSIVIESEAIPDCDRVIAEVTRTQEGNGIMFSLVFRDIDGA